MQDADLGQSVLVTDHDFMSDEKGEKKAPALLISAVQEDTLVETVFCRTSNKTALVVARDGSIETVPTWDAGGLVYRPVQPSHNLLKHSALLLPSEPAEYGNAQALLAEIQAYIGRYVSLPQHALGISAAYVLLSWVYDAFNEVPYLRFRGDYGTGKTRALMVIGSLCHKAFFASGASTVSPIFHTLDTFKGTLIVDEADFRFSDEKAELTKILNCGNAKGFPVLRTHVTPQKEFNPQAFSVFGPKIIGMRRSFEDRALESRFLTVEMEPGRSNGVPINLPDEQQHEALALRNKLLMYRLRQRLTVGIDASLADPGLEARMNQILLPLLSVVPNEALRAEILTNARAIQAGIVTERGASSEGQALTIVARLLVERPEETTPLSEIALAFATEYGAEYQRPITNRWIGSVLRRLGIALYKSNGVFVLMPGQNERVDALCVRYGIVDMRGKSCGD